MKKGGVSARGVGGPVVQQPLLPPASPISPSCMSVDSIALFISAHFLSTVLAGAALRPNSARAGAGARRGVVVVERMAGGDGAGTGWRRGRWGEGNNRSAAVAVAKEKNKGSSLGG